ncbi:MAG: hypothetical protein GEU74_13125 [Nitriliruptorales bacterium]|nr:hypothetical protein [Nitriliruptorales bacterium]
MTPATSTQLTAAARIADSLVYVVGIAGVIAGGLLLQRGDLGFAIVAWSLTFVAGAGLRLAASIARGMAEVLARQTRIDDAIADLRADRVAEQRRNTGRHWGA